MLWEYRALAAEATSIRRKLKRLRDEILAQLTAGIDVKPGDLTIQVKLFVQKGEDQCGILLNSKAGRVAAGQRPLAQNPEEGVGEVAR